MAERRTVKIVMVGDGAVGKVCTRHVRIPHVAMNTNKVAQTALCATFVNNQFPQDYIPTVFDNFSKLQTVDGEQVTMSIWDTVCSQLERERVED